MEPTERSIPSQRRKRSARICALAYAALAFFWLVVAKPFFPSSDSITDFSTLSLSVLAYGLLVGATAIFIYILLAYRDDSTFSLENAKYQEMTSDLQATGPSSLEPPSTFSANTDEHLRFATKVFDSSYNSIMITDAQANIVSINPAFTKMTGYEASEVIGKNPRILHSGRQNYHFYEMFWNSLLENGYWQGELWNRHKSGKEYLKWLSISAVRDQSGNITHYIGISDDITQTRENINKINFLASFDELTGLMNRSVATIRLEKEIAHAQYGGTRLAFLFLDLDNFKTVNESLGHATGDTMLKTVAQRLMSYVRNTGTVGRHGGDKFFIILPDIADPEAVSAAANDILKCIGKPITAGDSEFYLSASIGIAIFPDDGTNTDMLQKNAEMAMYSAKQAGRNTYRFFTEGMHAFVLERLLIRNGLLRALEKDELVLHYQPQVSLETGRMIGAEALLRWRRPDIGLVYPDNFIGVAEESGLIIPIGAWVLHEACRQAVAWQKAGWPELRIAVNISAVQFGRGDLHLTVAQALAASGLHPASLELEMTESALIQDIESSLDTIKRLKGLGVTLSLDDFGTGFSSLGYLKRLPVDKLKIDRSFVSDIMIDKEDAAIVLSVISLAHTLQKKVVAEGVETLEQLGFLQNHRCDEMQGFYYSRPISADDFMHLLRNDRRLESPEKTSI